MDVKSVFLYGKIEKEVYVCQPLGFKDPDFPEKVYKVKKALYGLHQASRAWYETLSTYLLDNRKEMCTEFEKMMHKKFQMSSMGELTFFLGLQVKQKEDGIFISQDNYVNEIMNKFGFFDVKTSSTPMETHKTLLKDEKRENVYEHLYRSMIRSLMYLTTSRPDIMFALCAYAIFQVNPEISHLHAVKRIVRYLKGQPKLGLWYPKDSPFDLVAYTDSDYAGASLDRKSTTGGLLIEGRLIMLICNGLYTNDDWNEVKQLLRMELRLTLLKVNVVRHTLTTAKLKVNAARHKFTTVRFNLMLLRNINEEAQIHAKVDGKKVIVSEETIRRDLKFEDEGGFDYLSNEVIFKQLSPMDMGKGSTMPSAPQHTPPIIQPTTSKPQKKQKPRKPRRQDTELPQTSVPTETVVDEAINEELYDSLERVTTTTTSFDPEQDRGGGPRRQDTTRDTIAHTRSENVSKQSNNPPLSRFNTLRSGKDILKLNELMELCTKLSERVLNLETTKTAQAKEISSLKERVKRLEKKRRSRNHRLKRLYKVGLSARVESSAEEQTLGEEDASKQGRNIADIDADAEITLVDETVEDQGRFNDQEMFDTNVLNDEEVVVEDVNATSIATAATTVVSIDDITLAQALVEIKTLKPKAREPLKMKRKDQISFDEQEARRLQAEFDEQDRLAEEKAQLIEDKKLDWDNVQAMMDADYELAARLQEEEQEELTVKEKSRLFVELMDKRKKHFTKLRAEEKRRKPPTNAQKRNQMCIYPKNMVGFTHSQLKNKSFDEVPKAFDKTMSWINSFVPMDFEVVKDKAELTQESSSKRVGDKLDLERSKKQKVKDDKESKELKRCLEIIPDDGDNVTIDATHLSIKTLIIDYKIYKEGKRVTSKFSKQMKIHRSTFNNQNGGRGRGFDRGHGRVRGSGFGRGNYRGVQFKNISGHKKCLDVDPKDQNDTTHLNVSDFLTNE
uniref:Reverse transcriptase Ty1/copia-type domain-containing protein n=1 Tax=Tanacetum cinerariifolium TaxID=118510 RepID=A0A699GZW8_TANCI|nr:hypothetical protein [Tanacetum cinerariifolium]